MTVELQEAPTIGVATIVEEEMADVPEMVSHLYHFLIFDGQKALCGVLPEQDPHQQMHVSYGERHAVFPPGATECQTCGAVVCGACVREAVAHKLW